IDSLRERRVMTLKTRLGNLGNVLDESSAQTKVMLLESPVLSNAEFTALQKYMGKTIGIIDCTFDPQGGEHAMRDALRRIRIEAEDAVRGGAS
ncbi:glutamate synthase central domain-containing protein, partial [Klebsiella pneumoniae]|uniref:glutamate synthase central domain-containing protein n=1 Tax=Klebsiella pneumoniae TaxID=573 RepID=UPI003854CDF9